VAVGDIVPVPDARLEDVLASASPDLLREMIRSFAQRMMDAEVEGICGAGYGEVSPERVNSRNGYRRREWDTRAGTEPVALSWALSAGVRSHALSASAMRAVG
jgi:putative transposase